MRVHPYITVIALSMLLAACAAPVLRPVPYSGPAIEQTGKPFRLIGRTGTAAGGVTSNLIPVGGIVVGSTSTGDRELQFNEEDQQIFISNLETELTRIGLFSESISLDHSIGTPAVELELTFLRTEHLSQMHDYRLGANVVVRDGTRVRTHDYDILSSQDESLFARMGTNAVDGKRKAAQRLLDAIIKDLTLFFAGAQ